MGYLNRKNRFKQTRKKHKPKIRTINRNRPQYIGPDGELFTTIQDCVRLSGTVFAADCMERLKIEHGMWH